MFGVQARFPETSVTITGRSSEYIRVGDEASSATFHFCPECGATVYWTSDAMEGTVAIPVGAFADPGFPGPTVSVYEERMHPWVVMPSGVEHIA